VIGTECPPYWIFGARRPYVKLGVLMGRVVKDDE
jgi:hypothetical protein